MAYDSSVEWNLLRLSIQGSVGARLSEAPGSGSIQQQQLQLIAEGRFAASLSLPSLRDLIGPEDASTDDAASGSLAARYFEAVQRRVQGFLEGERPKEGAEQLLLSAASALYIFLQANLTGPPLDVPECPADLHAAARAADIDAKEGEPAERVLGEEQISKGDRYAVRALSADGEEVEGRLRLLQYLLLARTILLTPLGLQHLGQPAEDVEQGVAQPSRDSLRDAAAGTGMRTWLWWTARVLVLQQRLLSSAAGSLRTTLLEIVPLVLQDAQSYMETVGEAGSSGVYALAQLEAVLMEHVYSHPAAAGEHLTRAGEALGFTAELTGAMGLRTEHQVDAKAQLVLETTRAGHSDGGSADSGDEAAELDACASREGKLRLADEAQSSDVLDNPRILETEPGTSSSQELTSLEQAHLLARSQQLQKSTARDELLGWQVAAFADAVLSQKRTRFLLRSAARLIRVRHERGRTRTRERALLSMEQLAEAAQAAEPPSSRRLRLAFAVLMPLRAALRKELGEQLVAAGMVGAAMQIFEEMELWDSLLICYRLLEKTPQALTLVQKRLESSPDDSRLLCALGDITLEERHYQEAWERSGRRSARAQRSLARMSMGRSQFQKAGEHWELALKLNPLHPEGWFALGYCCLKEQRFDRAVQAFTRAAQQQPDNGEAWNNLAAIHLQERRFKEAFSALREAVKYKRDSWQTWSNYAAAAVQTGNFQQAAHAVEQVGRMTQWQRQEVEVLQALVLAVKEAREKADTFGVAQTGGRRSEGGVLERAVQTALSAASTAPSASPAVWGQVALLNQALGYPDSVREALKKQLRGLAGSGWQQDPARFEEYAQAVLASARFYAQAAESATAAGAKRDLASARMLLQGILKTDNEAIRQHPLFGEVGSTLEDVASKEAALRE